MPLVSTVNGFSQLFTDNAVVSISDQVVGVSFPVMLLIIGIVGPMSEEFVFRGMIFEEERLHIVCGGELVIDGINSFVGCCDVVI